MEDLIRRADAIKALRDNQTFINGDIFPTCYACDVINEVPSADDWIPLNTELIASKYDVLGIHRGGFEPDTFMVVRKGADNE